jgi:nucleotide-binding universal stress UspA family protein
MKRVAALYARPRGGLKAKVGGEAVPVRPYPGTAVLRPPVSRLPLPQPPAGNGSPGTNDLRLRIIPCAEETSQAVLTYGRELARLLGTEAESRTVSDFDSLGPDAITGCDLVILGEPRQSLRQRLWPGLAAGRAVERWTGSLLLARQPRWPLRHILTIVRGEAADDPALTWTLRLATAARAGVTLLAVIPPLPGLYNTGSQVQAPLDVLLTVNSMTGSCLRRHLRLLDHAGLEAQLESQPGAPAEQIESQVRHSAPDLLVIAAESYSQFWRLWLGELVRPLVRWIDRPLLVARSASAK